MATKAPYSFVRRIKPIMSEVFPTYWRFAYLRQEVFFSKLESNSSSTIADPIIQEYKFTNCYRASDRVSQYLIKNVIYSKNWSLRDSVFRILLFKLFNKIETWELLEHEIGEISYRTFDLKQYGRILERAISSKAPIYSAAYIMPSGSAKKYGKIRKHQFHLALIESLISSGFERELRACKSMKEAYLKLLSVDSFGKFLAYQFVIDLNYSGWFNFSESEFVVPGPGAKDGIRKCFTHTGEYSESDIIKYMSDNQVEYFNRYDLEFRNLWGRDLQLIDCQNLFCEVDKYARIAHPGIMGISGRTRIKQKYKPKTLPFKIWYPPKWEVNEKIYPQNLKSFGM